MNGRTSVGQPRTLERRRPVGRTEGVADSRVTRSVATGAALLARLLEQAGTAGTVVLSGAGLSTESGIPDYRGPTGSRRSGTPMTYQTFTASSAARRRYWARSHLGWQQMHAARPNAGHMVVAELARSGLLAGIITQNVDGLHQAAGARHVVELHGALDRVVCLGCGRRTPRGELDARLRAANPQWPGWHADGALRPDGDFDLDESLLEDFVVVGCADCGGVLKPDVVFFGENVPRARVQASADLVAAARALVVLGSSLTVLSGRRLVVQAARAGLPVIIVNQGPTRADELAQLRVDAPLGQVLTGLLDVLTVGSSSAEAWNWAEYSRQ